MRTGHQRTILNWIVCVTGIVWILWDLPFIVLVLPTDFEYYYIASIRLLRGENIYYDWMAESVREGIGSWYLYPPYFAGLLTPLTWLGHKSAKTVFAGLAILAIIGIDAMSIRLRKRFFSHLPGIDMLIHCLVFFAMPTRLAIGSLQIEGMLFFLFLLLLYWTLEGRRKWGTGIAFVPGLLIKLWPGPFLLTLYAVWGKRIPIPVITVACGVIVTFTLFYGLTPQWDYLHTIFPVLLNYADVYKDNQSLSLFLSQEFFWKDWPIRILRWLILFSYLFVTVRCWMILREGNNRTILINASLFLCVSLLVTPTAWTATHIRLLLPMIGLCGFCVEEGMLRKWLLFIAFISVIFYAYPQELGKKILPVWIDRYPILYSVIFQYLAYLMLATESYRKRQPNHAD